MKVKDMEEGVPFSVKSHGDTDTIFVICGSDGHSWTFNKDGTYRRQHEADPGWCYCMQINPHVDAAILKRDWEVGQTWPKAKWNMGEATNE